MKKLLYNIFKMLVHKDVIKLHRQIKRLSENNKLLRASNKGKNIMISNLFKENAHLNTLLGTAQNENRILLNIIGEKEL